MNQIQAKQGVTQPTDDRRNEQRNPGPDLVCQDAVMESEAFIGN